MCSRFEQMLWRDLSEGADERRSLGEVRSSLFDWWSGLQEVRGEVRWEKLTIQNPQVY